MWACLIYNLITKKSFCANFWKNLFCVWSHCKGHLKDLSQPQCTVWVSSEISHFRCHLHSEILTVVLRSHCIGTSSLLSSEYLLLRVRWTIIEEICRYSFFGGDNFSSFFTHWLTSGMTSHLSKQRRPKILAKTRRLLLREASFDHWKARGDTTGIHGLKNSQFAEMLLRQEP